jgi:hypothetical protein
VVLGRGPHRGPAARSDWIFQPWEKPWDFTSWIPWRFIWKINENHHSSWVNLNYFYGNFIWKDPEFARKMGKS